MPLQLPLGELLAQLTAGSMLIDLAIAITLLEGVALAAFHWRTGRGMAPGDFLPNLAAGVMLMVALRAGLTAAGGGWVLGALMLAGLAHLADLRRRWTRPS
jgi:hypothetical protein